MSKQVRDIRNYTLSNSDAVLFDANIWMYIYGPEGNMPPSLKATYTLAFRRIRSAQIPIFLDLLVLSEFINAYARLAYNDLPKATRPLNFKTFRSSDDFKPLAAKIAEKSRRIASKCQRAYLRFDLLDLGSILNEYGTGNSDFNDQILAELCRDKGLKLVTHDADFRGENLTIITANSRLLA